MKLYVKGAVNVGKLIEAISDEELECLIKLNDFQAQVNGEKVYEVEIVYPCNGKNFELKYEEE